MELRNGSVDMAHLNVGVDSLVLFMDIVNQKLKKHAKKYLVHRYRVRFYTNYWNKVVPGLPIFSRNITPLCWCHILPS